MMKICPGCSLKSPSNCQDLINQLSLYTLSLQDTWFIHQLVVDIYAAQHAFKEQKPITISFALIGLYLTYEKGFSGKQVQRVHMALGKKSKSFWLKFDPPTSSWSLTVADVLKEPEGEKRNTKIYKWGESVWQVWKENNLGVIEALIKPFLDS